MGIKHTVWTITAKTNLHVGNESSSNFGIIDKAVQRDPITDLPCINASSLKGALNEYFSKNNKDGKYISLFGSDKRSATVIEAQKKEAGVAESQFQSENGNPKKANSDMGKGLCSFFDAMLIAIPRQCDSDSLFELCSHRTVIKDFLYRAQLFGCTLQENVLENLIKHPLTNNSPAFEKNYKKFFELCNDMGLPIIARNRVGSNTNLWYEQVVPRETVFATIISVPDDKLDDFCKALDGQVVQIGADASIGYGYCEFKRIM